MMVLSEEKKPLPAVDMMDMRVHLALSLYVSSIRSCAPEAETWASWLHADLALFKSGLIWIAVQNAVQC